jgi:hypothetical protein
VVVSRKNYYKNVPGDMPPGSSYQNKIFSTQISLELLLFVMVALPYRHRATLPLMTEMLVKGQNRRE